MPKKQNEEVKAKIEELENLNFDDIKLKNEEVQPEKKQKKNKKNKEERKLDDTAEEEYSEEQKEIAKLKSQLMQEKIKNVGRKKSKNFITKKEKRTFRDTSNDSNATTKSILKGAGFMVLAFGFLALLILLIKR